MHGDDGSAHTSHSDTPSRCAPHTLKIHGLFARRNKGIGADQPRGFSLKAHNIVSIRIKENDALAKN